MNGIQPSTVHLELGDAGRILVVGACAGDLAIPTRTTEPNGTNGAGARFNPLSATPLPPSTLRFFDDEAFAKLAQATPQRLASDIGLDIRLDFTGLRLVERLGIYDRLSRCRISG